MKTKFVLKASVAAVALALSASASAFSTVQVQFAGNGAVAGSVIADKLDAEPGNILFDNIEPTAAFPGLTSMNVLGHGTATWKFGATSLNPLGIEVTYVFGVPAVATVTSTFGGTDSIFHLATAGGGYFQVYQDNTPNSNALAGTGFNDGTLLFSGTFRPQAALASYTLTTTGPLAILDQFNTDDLAGLLTETISGSATYSIDVTYQDFGFILNDISTFSPTGDDVSINTSTLTPFNSVDPSASFQNVTDTGTVAVNYGDDTSAGEFVNNNLCGTLAPCDLHAQGDANMTFTSGQIIPEPESLVLLGLGLGAMGLISRRRKLVAKS